MTASQDVWDLLSPEERDELYADLAEIARLRHKAEAESANIVIGGHTT